MMASAAALPSSQHALGLPSQSARCPSSSSGRLWTSWAAIFAIFFCLVSRTLAATLDAAMPAETLVIDHRLPYRDGRGWVMLSEQDIERRRLQERAPSESSESSEESETSTTTSSGASVTTTFSIVFGTPKPSTTSTTVSASPLPSILDSMPSVFLPASDGGPAPCPVFINSFLTDPTFKQCYPLSMLFEKSKSFFEAKRSLLGITRTLDATCAANATFCNDYMQTLARNFTAPENCGREYDAGATAIIDVYDAMTAYAPVYGAGCLRDDETSAYCYANAVTNQTNYSMAYVYFLPLNKSLPGATVAPCNFCLQQTMALYQASTADRRQLISLTYEAAAKQVNTICGPGFVNESLAPVAVPATALAGVMRPSTWLSTAVVGLAAVLWLL